ncbi:beta-galactosidase [Clonorchis sinensis]|uniref:Beta-galactosidase n=1 Tax=Clonorchis sinensis TaxID=79923 RepID=G7Y4J6_CLOSI|nr:beta-galactosidase [Clonorchis sinensis]
MSSDNAYASVFVSEERPTQHQCRFAADLQPGAEISAVSAGFCALLRTQCGSEISFRTQSAPSAIINLPLTLSSPYESLIVQPCGEDDCCHVTMVKNSGLCVYGPISGDVQPARAEHKSCCQLLLRQLVHNENLNKLLLPIDSLNKPNTVRIGVNCPLPLSAYTAIRYQWCSLLLPRFSDTHQETSSDVYNSYIGIHRLPASYSSMPVVPVLWNHSGSKGDFPTTSRMRFHQLYSTNLINRTFEIDTLNDVFVKDNEEFQFISGSIHYFRIPRIYWLDRLQKARALGLDAVQM